MRKEYKYDVAFSFLAKDESKALELADLLKSRLSTFIYSEKQKELAGRDGEVAFNQVFADEARVVVILYRQEWGAKSWTKIEETAIRNRAHDEGYDFTIFIPMEPNITLPKWVPKNRLWIGLERWGINSAAAVIEARVQEQGGNPHEESLEETAARKHDEIQKEIQRQEFLRSQESLNLARTELHQLPKIFQDRMKALPFDPREVGNIWWPHGIFGLDIMIGKFGLSLDLRYKVANAFDDAHLEVALWRGVPRRPGRPYVGNPVKSKSVTYKIDVENNALGWRLQDSNKRLITTSQLAEESLKLLIDFVHECAFEPQREQLWDY